MPRALACLSFVVALAAGARPAGGQGGGELWVEPDGSLASLRRALRSSAAGERKARLVFYGASHTASDQYTGEVRRRLASRFGDGGPGFVMPVRPFSLYAHAEVEVAHGGPWRPRLIFRRQRSPGRYGAFGMAADTSRRAWARARTEQAVDHVSVHYLAQAGGGGLRVETRAGHTVAEVDTSDGAGPRSLDARLPEGTHQITVRVDGTGPVRLLGLALERGPAGVVVDTAGVPGARARDQLAWDWPTQRALLSTREPALVALAYGTNESGDRRVPIASYRARLVEVLDRLREATPGASCLLVGPGPWPSRDRDGALAERARTRDIVRVQREVATSRRCAFFDLFAFIGGEEGMALWVDEGLALGDHVHLTDAGHARLARALVARLTSARSR